MASVVLRLVETLEQTEVLVENWALPHGDESRDGKSRGGRWGWVEGRTECLLHRTEVGEPHSLCALSAVSHVRAQLRCCLARVGSHAPWCPWKSHLRVDGLQCLITWALRGLDPSPDTLTKSDFLM